MRIVIISDTHNHRIALPSGDVLVHCGDCTNRGTMAEFGKFAGWFRAQPHPHKVLIAGNHDFCLEGVDRLPGVEYLRDSEVDVCGLRIYGSPWTPTFYQWAFMLDRGPQIAERWAMIPAGLDLLVTHGPPHGILDAVPGAGHQGCEELAKTVERVKPRVHAFGHLHPGYGREARGGTEYVNAAVCDDTYAPVNAPSVVDL